MEKIAHSAERLLITVRNSGDSEQGAWCCVGRAFCTQIRVDGH